jgi:hypothetical protein
VPLFLNPIVLIYFALAITWAFCVFAALILLLFRRFRIIAQRIIIQATFTLLGFTAPIVLYWRDISELHSLVIFIIIFLVGGVGGFFLGRSLALKINRRCN